MSAALHTWNQLSVHWTTLTVAVVWQSTLLALVVAAIAYAWRGASPAVRYWLWQIVAIKLVLMPLWSWPVLLPSVWVPVAIPNEFPGGNEVEPPFVSPSQTQAPVRLKPDLPGQPVAKETSFLVSQSRAWRLNEITWQGWLMAAWAIIIAGQVAQLVWQRYRLSRLLRATQPAGIDLTAAVAEAAAGLQLARPPDVRLTTLDCSPFVCGILRPKLVLPRELLATFDEGELRQVLAHELAHVKRRDLLWGWLSQIATLVYFFHPVAHWVSYRVRLERELACDQLAMAACGRGPAAYAETLVRIVSSISRPNIFRVSAVARLDGDAPIDNPTTRPGEPSP